MTPTDYSIIAICIAVVGLFYNVLKSPKEEHQRVVERGKSFVQQGRRFLIRTLNIAPYVASIGLFVWYGVKVTNSAEYTGTDVLMLVVGAFLTLLMAGLLGFIRFGRKLYSRISDSKIESTELLNEALTGIRDGFVDIRKQVKTFSEEHKETYDTLIGLAQDSGRLEGNVILLGQRLKSVEDFTKTDRPLDRETRAGIEHLQKLYADLERTLRDFRVRVGDLRVVEAQLGKIPHPGQADHQSQVGRLVEESLRQQRRRNSQDDQK